LGLSGRNISRLQRARRELSVQRIPPRSGGTHG
jgi:hypothetical protein